MYATVLARWPNSQPRAGRGAEHDQRPFPLGAPAAQPHRVLSPARQGLLFFGSQNGTVYALNARNGNSLWTYHAAGAVKASPSLSNGVLYFGDYSGELQAVCESNGHRMWRSGSGGALLGSGTFYSTPAVVYGRVFLGNTDGRVYAYDASSGKLDWAVQTGAYVYASPAVANAPGLGPTIYSGSYDGRFYAIDARSGHIEWTISRRRQDLRLGHHRRQHRLFRRPRHPPHLWLGISTGRVAFPKTPAPSTQ